MTYNYNTTIVSNFQVETRINVTIDNFYYHQHDLLEMC